jgi:hypothetical protein
MIAMKTGKRILSMVLALVMLLALIPATTLPAFAASSGDTIDMGDPNPPAFGDGWTYANNVYTITGSGITVIGSNAGSQRRIQFDDNSNGWVILRGVTINVGGTDNAAAFYTGKNSTVTVNLWGENTLISGDGRAGLEVPAGSELNIYNYQYWSETTLNATGGTGATGIGAADGGDCGVINIHESNANTNINAVAGKSRNEGWRPETEFAWILWNAGFTYDPKSDLFFARKDASQYALGYTFFYGANRSFQEQRSRHFKQNGMDK